MGRLMLGRITRVDLPDDVLAHVHAVIIAKLRVREPVLVGWIAEDGHHDEVIVNPAMPIVVHYDVDEEQRIDRRWANRLMVAANGVGGLRLTPELVDALRGIEREEADAAGGAGSAPEPESERSAEAQASGASGS